MHLELKRYREGAGRADILRELQIRHQQAFMRSYSTEVRPKHHLRLHLPDMYSMHSHPYMGCWCLESKHKLYKNMMSDQLQHLYHEGDGAVSQQVSAQILHSTIQQMESVESRQTLGLTGRVHPADKVHELTGMACPLSLPCNIRGKVLRPNHVVLWKLSNQLCAGKIEFFALHQGDVIMIYEHLDRRADEVPFAFRFQGQGCKGSILVADMKEVRTPSWWTVDKGTMLCLE